MSHFPKYPNCFEGALTSLIIQGATVFTELLGASPAPIIMPNGQIIPLSPQQEAEHKKKIRVLRWIIGLISTYIVRTFRFYFLSNYLLGLSVVQEKNLPNVL